MKKQTLTVLISFLATAIAGYAGHHSTYSTSEDFEAQVVAGSNSHTETFQDVPSGSAAGETFDSSGNGFAFQITSSHPDPTAENERLHGYVGADEPTYGWEGNGIRANPRGDETFNSAALVFDFTGGAAVNGVGGFFWVSESGSQDAHFNTDRSMTLTYTFQGADDVVLNHGPHAEHSDSFVGLTSENEITGLTVAVDGNNHFSATDELTVVPEPATAALLASLLAVGAVLVRRKTGGAAR